MTLKLTAEMALLGTLACLSLTSCTRVSAKSDVLATDVVPVRAERAFSQDIPLEITAVGNVEAINRVDVRSRIAGQITRVAFEEGQSVTKGQLLFSIDRSTLERQAAEQQAELQRDAAVEQQARAVVARDEAQQKQNQSEASVAEKLGDLGVLSGQRVNQIVTASNTSGASLQSDQAAVEAAAGSTRADRARLAQTQLEMNFTDVVAPISGRAGVVTAKTGNMVRENDTTLVTLLQMTPIQVAFGIPEQSFPEVQRLNATHSLTVQASNGDGPPLEGRLVFIDNTVDATTGTIRLKSEFPNTDNALWPGEFVNVRLRLDMEKSKTLVPESAIQDGLDGKYVWRAHAGIASMALVTVLRTYKPPSGPELAVIGSGINPGDLIVTEGQLRLSEGVHISMLEAPRAGQSQAGAATSTR